jgi:polyvinyl alcohol dehydrogenase (cytochrome)
MVMHALDAASGKELWNVKVDDHVLGRITGAPTLYQGLLYVPLASGEENMANQASYGCCTFRGTVVAVDAKDGHIVWKSRVTEEPAKPTRKNSAGTQMYGPAGGAIWSSPTIDAKRGQLYITTGDSYTEVTLPTSDSVMAMDLKTGKIRWSSQVLADDNFMGRGLNVPLGTQGPDFDFGSSSHLITLPTGKDILVTGNKSATVYGMDPDTGKIIWSNKIGGGGALGGVEFGSATDGKIVYTPLADAGANGRPGLVALNPADGKELWRVDAPKGVTCNVPSGRCGLGYSQAASAIPGAVFSGSQDGRLRAYSDTGKLLWEYETTQPIDTVNGVKAAVGGSLDFAGPTIAGGMVYVHSGYNGNAGPNSVLYAFSVDGK